MRFDPPAGRGKCDGSSVARQRGEAPTTQVQAQAQAQTRSPEARAPSPYAADRPAESAEVVSGGGLLRSAGFRGVRPGSAQPPPWPMGRVGQAGRH